MAIFLFYKKKSTKSRNYPWQELCQSPEEAVAFMERMGEAYEFWPFESISVADVYEMADE
jgi:hypothetical protein